jgi:hypothetical protein
MKYITYSVLLVIAIVALIGLDKRDDKLMALCANHDTQTLYQC